MEKVCRADVAEIGRTAKELTAVHFPAGEGATPVRFAVAYEHRASKDLDRMAVINSVVDQIPQVIIFMMLSDTPSALMGALCAADTSLLAVFLRSLLSSTVPGGWRCSVTRLTRVYCVCSRRTRWT